MEWAPWMCAMLVASDGEPVSPTFKSSPKMLAFLVLLRVAVALSVVVVVPGRGGKGSDPVSIFGGFR